MFYALSFHLGFREHDQLATQAHIVLNDTLVVELTTTAAAFAALCRREDDEGRAAAAVVGWSAGVDDELVRVNADARAERRVAAVEHT